MPPPDTLRNMLPFVSERMRKRRCFADKEVEVAMFERERAMEMEKLKQAGLGLGQRESVDLVRSRQMMSNMAPREFLQRIFPTINPNVIELVWQGCGSNLERAIEQLKSSNHVRPTNALPVTPNLLSHMTISSPLQPAQATLLKNGLLPGQQYMANLSLPLTQYRQALMARMPFHAMASVRPSTSQEQETLLSERSAFKANIPARSPDSVTTNSSTESSTPEKLSNSGRAASPSGNKGIKFSVESIIGAR